MRNQPYLYRSEFSMSVQAQDGSGQPRNPTETRRHPRFKLETAIRIYARNRAVVRGKTVDVSESGISAMLLEEVPLDELVRLEFALPFGEVQVHAMVRQRNAFRYGFQFVENLPASDIIGRTCRALALEQGAQDIR